MDQMDLNEYTSKLNDEKKLLEEELSKIARRDPDNPGNWELVVEPADETSMADKNEAADRFEDFSQTRSTEISLVERLKNVEKALEKIASGTYGICEVGGELIEEARLKANPAAITCVKHAE